VARKLDWGFLRYFAVVAGLPFFIAGYVTNLLPFIIPGFICARLIKDPRFFSSVYISSGTVLYLIYFPLLLILAGIFAGWTGFFLALLVPLAGYFVLFYLEIFRERKHTLRFSLKKTFNPDLIKTLTSQRQDILGELDKVKL
jgi:hypothetical protein